MATGKTIPLPPHCCMRSSRRRANGLVADSASGAAPVQWKKHSPASRTAFAGRSCATAPATAGAAERFRRDAFLALPYFDALHRFLPALFRRDGYAIGYVDVIDRPRHSGKSNYGLWDRLWVGILDLAGVWWLIRRRKKFPQVSEV